MGGATEFCRHAGDPEGCMASLVEAYRAGTLQEHCIMIGLQHGHPQCLQALTAGLKGSGLGQEENHESVSAASEKTLPAGQLLPAAASCQAALHLAWQKDIQGAKNFFVEFYQNLVWSALCRFGLRGEEAQAVFQDVFLAMSIRMKGPEPFRGKLSAYLWTVVRSCALKFWRGRPLEGQLDAEPQVEDSLMSEAADPNGPSRTWRELVEWWEDLDLCLKNHPDGTLVQRILLAQGFIFVGGSKERTATKSILESWRKLAAGDEAALALVAREAAARLALSPETAVVWIATDMLREGSARIWHLPVILGQDAGMTAEGVLDLARELAAKSIGYVDMCVYAMKRILADHLRRDFGNSGKE